MNRLTYELADVLVIATLAATCAYLLGRAHAERAAHRNRTRLDQARNRHATKNQQTKKEQTK